MADASVRATGKKTAWRPSRASLRLRFHCLLIVVDLGALIVATTFANTIFHGLPFAEAGTPAAAALVLLYLVGALQMQCYTAQIALHATSSVSSSIRALIAAAAGLLVLAFMLKAGGEISRLMLGVALVVAALLLGLGRTLVAKNAAALLGGSPLDVVVISDGPGFAPPTTACRLFIDAASFFDPATQNPDAFHRLATAIGGADRVIVYCPPSRRPLWAKALRGANVQSEIVAQELSPLTPIGTSAYAGVPTLIVTRGPLRLPQRVTKRAFDLAVAGLALLLLAPIMAVVAVLIRATSEGPVLFVQPRIGRQNAQFNMYKFRSMRPTVDAAAGHRSTARDDDRVTPVGRIIRKTSIDELPQLLNVLRGEMSIIGPRPHALGSTAADLLFWEVDRRYWDRHAIKPGLTGLAQVRGFRGATLQRSDLENRVTADLEYVDRWSLWLDLTILVRTLFVVLHRNAF